MDKKDALEVIVKCAKLYNENLQDKNVMIISQFGNERNKINIVECIFTKSNFMHLTGVVSNVSANMFYSKCLNGKLSLDDFNLKDDGTTVLKLSVLPRLMNFHKTAKMIGDFNKYKSKLCVEKLAGGISACLGLNKIDRYYVPVTALKADLRDSTYKQERIIAMFTKSTNSKSYTHITYSANEVSIVDELYIQIMEFIDMENLVCDFCEKPVILNRMSELIKSKISTEKIALKIDIEL